MAAEDRVLEILVRTKAELAGLDETKAKLEEVKQETQTSADKTGDIASGFGVAGVAATAAGLAIVATVNQVIQLWQEQQRFNEELRQTSQELDRQEGQWLTLAQNASKFVDVVRLGLQIIPQIGKLEDQLAQTGAKRLTLTQAFLETLAQIGGHPGPGIFTAEQERQIKALQELIDLTKARGMAELTVAQDSVAAWEKMKSLPVAEALAQVETKLQSLREEQAKLASETIAPDVEGYAKINTELATWQKHLEELNKKQGAQVELVTQTSEKLRLAQVAGDRLAEAGERAQQAFDRTKQEALELGLSEEEATREAEKAKAAVLLTAEARERSRAASTGETGIQRELNALMREHATLMQTISQQRQLIQASPFLTIDQKNTLLLETYERELTLIAADIQQTRAAMAGSALDPAQYARLNQALQQSVFRFQMIRQEMQELTFSGAFRGELTQFVNSFGTAGQQAARAITGPLNTAIGGVSQGLSGLIFGAQNWQQSFVQAAQSIVQQLIQIGLQLLVQKALGTALTTATVAESAVAGPAIATAYAPAAAATSVASFGVSATTGATSALGAIAAIIGALTFAHEGGVVGQLPPWTGGPLASDERLVVTRLGEIILPTHKTPVSRMHAGGIVGGGGLGASGGITIATFTDRKALVKYLATRQGRKIIVDTINGRRIDLGLPT